jgi:hypothetical protein
MYRVSRVTSKNQGATASCHLVGQRWNLVSLLWNRHNEYGSQNQNKTFETPEHLLMRRQLQYSSVCTIFIPSVTWTRQSASSQVQNLTRCPWFHLQVPFLDWRHECLGIQHVSGAFMWLSHMKSIPDGSILMFPQLPLHWPQHWYMLHVFFWTVYLVYYIPIHQLTSIQPWQNSLVGEGDFNTIVPQLMEKCRVKFQWPYYLTTWALL